jgi:hypothetical protein
MTYDYKVSAIFKADGLVLTVNGYAAIIEAVGRALRNSDEFDYVTVTRATDEPVDF